MKYGRLSWQQAGEFAREGRPLWACVYGSQGGACHPRTREAPFQGRLVSHRGDYYMAVFCGHRVRMARPYSVYQFGDTCEEALALYREQIEQHIRVLDEWKEEALYDQSRYAKKE